MQSEPPVFLFLPFPWIPDGMSDENFTALGTAI